MLTASPTRSTQSNLFFNAPPIADAIFRLVVTSPCEMAALEGQCSTRLSIFRWAPFRRPKQGENTQRARSRAPGAFIRLIGSRDAMIWGLGGCLHEERGQRRWGKGMGLGVTLLCVRVREGSDGGNR